MSKVWLAAAFSTLATAAIYLGAASQAAGLGFPLDDAWIHQVYARNLAINAEWAFVPGSPSAGSTAPLWSGALSIAYFLDIDHLAWTYALGLGLLLISAAVGARWLAVRMPGGTRSAWLLALLFPLEWHLAWASLSGMETLAVGAIAIVCFYGLESRRVGIGAIGALIGLGVWLRPDALTLLIAPIGYLILSNEWRQPKPWLYLTVGVAVLVVPYLAFQRGLSGEWWPNTFFAKQAEYAALQELPLLTRLAAQVGIPGEWLGAPGLDSGGPLVGVLVVLAPGMLVVVKYRAQSREWTWLLPLVWVGVYLGIYALRLPVTYQHGRYAIPVIPTLLVIGFEGMLRWARPGSTKTARRVFSRAWVILTAISAGIFWLLGARAYARDAAIIETEMVATALWIETNTPEDAIVAAHDIGALGYFATRELIDLAGLVSPEVIPFIRDEVALAAHLDSNHAEYLVTFPGWYPVLTSGAPLLFTTDGIHSPVAGGENMAVYQWNWAKFPP